MDQDPELSWSKLRSNAFLQCTQFQQLLDLQEEMRRQEGNLAEAVSLLLQDLTL